MPVIVCGCGVMGRKITEALLEKKRFEIVGAIDVAYNLVGKDLGGVLELARSLGIAIQRVADFSFEKAISLSGKGKDRTDDRDIQEED